MLLFGMMIVVANLRLSGFFRLVSAWVVEHAHRPHPAAGGHRRRGRACSRAFFVNDTMCLVLTPLVLEITRALRRKPMPYLLAVAMASQHRQRRDHHGQSAEHDDRHLLAHPVPHVRGGAGAGRGGGAGADGGGDRADVPRRVPAGERAARWSIARCACNRALMWKSLAVSAAMIVFFFAGWPVPKVALVAGALLLITRRVKPERIYREIDWPLLVMFIGLFIVVAGMEKTPLAGGPVRGGQPLSPGTDGALSIFAALLSNLVSNVPAVLIFKGFVPHLAGSDARVADAGHVLHAGGKSDGARVRGEPDRDRSSARRRVRIGFWEYAQGGMPLTMLTLAAGVLDAKLAICHPS